MAHQPHVSHVRLQFKSYRRIVKLNATGEIISDNEVSETYEKTVPVIKPGHTEHSHCGTCGTCFIGGIEYIHRCPEPIRPDILEIMCDEMRGTDEKTRIMNRISTFKGN